MSPPMNNLSISQSLNLSISQSLNLSKNRMIKSKIRMELVYIPNIKYSINVYQIMM